MSSSRVDDASKPPLAGLEDRAFQWRSQPSSLFGPRYKWEVSGGELYLVTQTLSQRMQEWWTSSKEGTYANRHKVSFNGKSEKEIEIFKNAVGLMSMVRAEDVISLDNLKYASKEMPPGSTHEMQHMAREKELREAVRTLRELEGNNRTLEFANILGYYRSPQVMAGLLKVCYPDELYNIAEQFKDDSDMLDQRIELYKHAVFWAPNHFKNVSREKCYQRLVECLVQRSADGQRHTRARLRDIEDAFKYNDRASWDKGTKNDTTSLLSFYEQMIGLCDSGLRLPNLSVRDSDQLRLAREELEDRRAHLQKNDIESHNKEYPRSITYAVALKRLRS